MPVEFRINPSQWNELTATLRQEKLVARAAAAALSRTADSAATQVRRTVAGWLKVPVRQLGTNKSGRGLIKPIHATPERLEARVRIANFNIPMIKTRGTPHKGDALPLRKVGDAVELPNEPFQQTMPSGHFGWFVRYGEPRKMESGRYVGWVRQPIKQVYARSPRHIFEQSGTEGAILADAAETLEKNIRSQIKRFLDRKG